MAPYTGPGNFPYWMTISNDGVHGGAGAQSENVPATPGLGYLFSVTAAYQNTYASGFGITLGFYQANGTLISSFSSTQGSMTGGQQYQLVVNHIAPALTDHMILSVAQTGLPSSANLLQVYQAEMQDPNNASINLNYNFTWTFWPWTASGTGAVLGWQASPLVSGDSDSLVLDNIIELMGGTAGVPSDIPELQDVNGIGPTFRILAPPSMNSSGFGYEGSYDFNAPQPTQDVVASMLLDGERPFGARASNREIMLPIIVFGTQAGGMAQVLAAREYLMALIDQQTWQIKWTPADTGLGLIFDCFRALPSNPVYGFNYSAGGEATGSAVGHPNYPIALVTIHVQALPYGRSDIDGVQTLAFSNNLVNGVPAASATVIDNLTTGPASGNGVFAPLGGGTHTTALIGFFNSAGTTSATFSLGFQGAGVPVSVFPGDACLVVVTVPAAATVAASDSAGNVYTQVASFTGGADQIYVLACYNCNTLTSTSTITVTQSVNQKLTLAALNAPGVVGIDTSATASGSSTAPSVAVGQQRYYGNFELVIFTNAGANTNSTPAGWSAVTPNLGVNPFTNIYGRYTSALGGDTCTSSYASSQTWLALGIAFETNFRWNAVSGSGPGNSNSTAVHYQAPRPVKFPHPAAVYSGTLSAAVSIVGNPVLSVWFGQAYDVQWPKDPKFVSNVRMSWMLTDSSGRTLSFSHTHKKVQYGAHPQMPKWTLISTYIPQGKKNFSYNAIAAYQLTITNWHAQGHTGYIRMHAWLNGITANPQTISNAMSPRGTVYNLFSLPGTARSPISVQCQLPAANPITKEITTPASGNWIVPPGVHSVQAEAWAGGGAGAAVNLSRLICGGGGGGGEYAQEPALVVTPGSKVPWSLGVGGTPGQIQNTVIQFNNLGLSHWTCPAGVTTATVECWGAGAAGGAGAGGGGAGGYSSKSQAVTPGTTYYIWTGKGGKADIGTTSSDAHQRSGQGSWFGNPGTKTGANALVFANGGTSSLTGGTAGGPGGSVTGAIGTTKFSGGRGGMSPGPGGGGGGGAAGATANGGPGGNSTPFTFSGGRWQAGGSAGQGNGQGGNGGIGAAAPGFPGAGSAPGGGGGGGYSATTLNTALNPSNATPGTNQVNYLGGDGGNGRVQLTYSVGNGNPINGTATTFGSAGTTGTVVTANGGTSAPNNSSAGAAGGTGSANTIHFNGGAGALSTSGAQASYLLAPKVSNLFQSLNTATWNGTNTTTGVAGSSCSQGVAIALLEQAAADASVVVTDSAGNIYNLTNQQGAGAGGAGAAVSAYVANIEFPITTSTTLTVSGSVSQQSGVIWYASPFLVSDTSPANNGSGHGNGTAVSASFLGGSDITTTLYELAVVVNDNTQSNANLTQAITWYPAGSTNSLTSSNLVMSAYVMNNQGGGTGTIGTGDTFGTTLGATSNWAVICVPLVAANQQSAMVLMDWKSGTTPGAQTTWTNEAALQNQGMIVVLGTNGSGAAITSAPSAIGDASGNTYAFKKTLQLPSNSGMMWAAVAPVTHALGVGASGTINWGNASASPEYAVAMFWVPNATGTQLDSGTIQGVTGSSTTPSMTYTPGATGSNSLAVSLLAYAQVATGMAVTGAAAPWNQQDSEQQVYMNTKTWAAQVTDEAAVTASPILASSSPWGMIGFSIPLNPAGSGGGAAAGPDQAGYPGVSLQGAPGFAGGGKGGQGALSVNTAGGGAAFPGGGGGGACSNVIGGAEGGQGGNGALRLTWSPPLKTFNSLLVHRPGDNTDPSFNPLMPIPITDVPNNTEYVIPSVNTLNATFSGTYTVLLAAYTWDAVTSPTPRHVTITINQYEYQGGPRSSVQVSRAVVPATDSVNGLIAMGEVTLPIKDYVNYNDQAYFTVSINDTNSNDRFMDVLFLDTTGQTVLINIDPGQAGYGQYVNYFIDEATPDRDLGYVGASMQDRQHQVSVLDYAMISGGPLYIGAGDNLFLTYSPEGAPNLAVQYAPRWYLDRSMLCGLMK